MESIERGAAAAAAGGEPALKAAARLLSAQLRVKLHFTSHLFVKHATRESLWLQKPFITEEGDSLGPRELATCLTRSSVGVIAFPVSLLFHFRKNAKAFPIKPRATLFFTPTPPSLFSLSLLLAFIPPLLPLAGSNWSVMRGREGSRHTSSQLAGSCIQKPLCTQDVSPCTVVS